MNLYESIKDGYDYKSKQSKNLANSKKVLLNAATYTKIARAIDDACAEEMDELEIQLFLQSIINHCRDTAEAHDVLVETDSDTYDSIMIDVETLEPVPVCYNFKKPMTLDEIKKVMDSKGYELDSIGEETNEKGLKGRTFKCNMLESTKVDSTGIIGVNNYEFI